MSITNKNTAQHTWKIDPSNPDRRITVLHEGVLCHNNVLYPAYTISFLKSTMS